MRIRGELQHLGASERCSGFHIGRSPRRIKRPTMNHIRFCRLKNFSDRLYGNKDWKEERPLTKISHFNFQVKDESITIPSWRRSEKSGYILTYGLGSPGNSNRSLVLRPLE
jgi:hypothetical protein